MVSRLSFGPEKDEVVLDLKGAYSCPALKKLERTFIYNRAQGTVTIRDEVSFSEPIAFDVPVTTLVRVEKSGEGLVLVGRKAKLRAAVRVEGGNWSWDEHILENGRPTTPRRMAVTFEKPVTKALVEFTFAP